MNPLRQTLGAVAGLLISTMSLTACQHTTTDSVIPQGDRTMDSLYRQTMSGSSTIPASLPNRYLSWRTVSQPTDDVADPIVTDTQHTQLALLPNPAVPVTIYPHYATVGDESLPVPGYTTVFPLYRTPHYRMQTEVSE